MIKLNILIIFAIIVTLLFFVVNFIIQSGQENEIVEKIISSSINIGIKYKETEENEDVNVNIPQEKQKFLNYYNSKMWKVLLTRGMLFGVLSWLIFKLYISNTTTKVLETNPTMPHTNSTNSTYFGTIPF